MKTKILELLAVGVATALCAQVSFAQESDASKTDQDQSKQSGLTTQTSTQTSASAQSELRLSKLKGATVKSNSGDKLGKLDDFVLDSESGRIKFAVLGHGGVLGIGEKRMPVPWQALNLQSQDEFTMNIDKDKIKSAPTTDSKYAELDNPQFVASLYQFYEVQPQAMGGSEATLGGSESGSAKTHHKSHSHD